VKINLQSFSHPRPASLVAWLLTASLFTAELAVLAANDLSPEASGFRIGYSASSLKKEFVSTEIFAEWLFLTRQTSDGDWYCEGLIEFSLGAIHFEQQTAFEILLGPVLRVGRTGTPLFVELGWSPTVLSKHTYQERNFGADLQFTSHIGAGIRLNDRWQVEYRYAHISNGGFASPNPGLNFHSVGVRFTF